jgi:hypothetical protein
VLLLTRVRVTLVISKRLTLRRYALRMCKPLPAYPLPVDEEARLACLPGYDIFGTEPEAEYDQLTELAAE